MFKNITTFEKVFYIYIYTYNKTEMPDSYGHRCMNSHSSHLCSRHFELNITAVKSPMLPTSEFKTHLRTKHNGDRRHMSVNLKYKTLALKFGEINGRECKGFLLTGSSSLISCWKLRKIA